MCWLATSIPEAYFNNSGIPEQIVNKYRKVCWSQSYSRDNNVSKTIKNVNVTEPTLCSKINWSEFVLINLQSISTSPSTKMIYKLKEFNGFNNLLHSGNGSMYSSPSKHIDFTIQHLPTPVLCTECNNSLTCSIKELHFFKEQ